MPKLSTDLPEYFALRLPAGVTAQLEAAAQREGKRPSALARELILFGLRIPPTPPTTKTARRSGKAHEQ